MNSGPPEPKLRKPKVPSCLVANFSLLFLTHGIHRLPYSPFAYILCQDSIAYKSWHEKSKRRIMIVTQSLKQSLHVLLLTQPVKDVCACVEVQDEALQLLQARILFAFFACMCCQHSDGRRSRWTWAFTLSERYQRWTWPAKGWK